MSNLGVEEMDAKGLVLVVDDDELVRESLAAALEGRGFQVRACEDAKQALARLRGGFMPDVILLDLAMPGMSGWEFRLAQKSDPRWCSIPVVAVSADTSAQAAAMDVDAFVPKPVSHSELLQTVERLHCAAQRERRHEQDETVAQLREVGSIASVIADQLVPSVNALSECLRIAQQKLFTLEQRVGAAHALAAADLGQLLRSADRHVRSSNETLAAVTYFAQYALHTRLRGRRILVAHSEPRLALLIREALCDENEVLTVHSGQAAAQVLDEQRVDVFLCELTLPDLDGIELYERLLRSEPGQADAMVFLTPAGGFISPRARRFFAQHRPWQLRAPFAAADVRELVDAHWRALH